MPWILQDSGANQVSRGFIIDKDSSSVSVELSIINPNYTRSFGFTLSIYDVYGDLKLTRDFVYDQSYGPVVSLKYKLVRADGGLFKAGKNYQLVISRSGPNNQEIQVNWAKIDTSGVGI